MKITIALPSGSRFESVASAGRSCTGTKRRLTCTVGTLPMGKIAKLRFVARVSTRADVRASVSGKTAESSLANNAAHTKNR